MLQNTQTMNYLERSQKDRIDYQEEPKENIHFNGVNKPVTVQKKLTL